MSAAAGGRALEVCAMRLGPQAFVTACWQLLALIFLMGISPAELLPCITAVIPHDTPDHVVGTVLGDSIFAAQLTGQVLGLLIGGREALNRRLKR